MRKCSFPSTGTILASVLVASVISGSWARTCDVCHLRNLITKDIATPEDWHEEAACQQYNEAACCSSETAVLIGNGGYDVYYGEEWGWQRCGTTLSEECYAWFVHEACFYECDVNAGKFRRDDNCSAVPYESNWKMHGMPMKASQCDSWWAACQNDHFCEVEDKSIFGGTCDQATMCKPASAIYANAQEFCEILWDGAFAYETNEDSAYSFWFPEGTRNPNDLVQPGLGYPSQCDSHDPDVTECASPFDLTLEAEVDHLQELIDQGLGKEENCDVCHARYWHKDHATETDFGLAEAQACAQYQDNSCCTLETADNVHNDMLYGEEFRWDRCGELSPACHQHFVNEACLYECDVHVGKWRKHEDCFDEEYDDENGWQILGMPLKASLCDDFFESCKADRFCANMETKSFFDQPCDLNTECRRFDEIYADGKEMCEKLWSGSFVYETNEEHAYTWDFAVGEANPNNDVLPAVAFPPQCPGHDPDASGCYITTPELEQRLDFVQSKLDQLSSHVSEVLGQDPGCDVCHLQYHHKEVSHGTEFANHTVACAQYRENSCCTQETAMNVHNDALYGEEYRWDRCGELSPACHQHFVNEACLYECDVNAGKFRSHEDCFDEEYGAENAWQILGMPLKASLCDDFFESCKADRFCANMETKSFFDQPCDLNTECRRFDEIYADGKEMCEKLWSGSFVYETNEEHAYTWDFAVGETNPNNNILPTTGYPPLCPDIHPEDASACDHETILSLEEQVAAINQEMVPFNNQQAQIEQLKSHVESVLHKDPHCDLCHLQYHHKDVANSTAFSSPTSACAQYQENSCCTEQTALNVHNDALYGEEFRWDRCGELSPACHQHFVNEACLYECDVNAGKFRWHEDCFDEEYDDENAWQILGMPLKASLCDDFFESCKADRFCANMETKSFFDQPCDLNTECRRFDEIYADGKEMCEKLWSGSFVYETNEDHAYTWNFAVGEANPNNNILPSTGYPPICTGIHAEDASDCDHDIIIHLQEELAATQNQLEDVHDELHRLEHVLEHEEHDDAAHDDDDSATEMVAYVGLVLGALALGLVLVIGGIMLSKGNAPVTVDACLKPGQQHAILEETAL